MESKKVKSEHGDLDLKIYNYDSNGRLAILLYKEDGELYSDLTINLHDMIINSTGEAYLSSDMQSLSKKIIDDLKKDGVIEKSMGFYKYNYGEYELVRFNLDKLKEYDPDGFEKFYHDTINYEDHYKLGI